MIILAKLMVLHWLLSCVFFSENQMFARPGPKILLSLEGRIPWAATQFLACEVAEMSCGHFEIAWNAKFVHFPGHHLTSKEKLLHLLIFYRLQNFFISASKRLEKKKKHGIIPVFAIANTAVCTFHGFLECEIKKGNKKVDVVLFMELRHIWRRVLRLLR